MDPKNIRHSLLISVLSTLFGSLSPETIAEVEAGIQWLHLKKGDLLFRQGDTGDSLYILLNGRLRAVTDAGTKTERILGDITKAETVGEMALFANEVRSASVIAVRDSELVRFPKQLFDQIKIRHPQILIPISNVIINRLKKANTLDDSKLEVKNVAIFPASPGTNLSRFIDPLVESISNICSVFHLSSNRVDQLMGIKGISQAAIDTPEEMQLLQWIEEREDISKLILFEADLHDSEWTRRCIRQSDRIMVVGRFGSDPNPSILEQQLIYDPDDAYSPEKNLVILHSGRTQLPSGTSDWLKNRKLRSHYHICEDDTADVKRLARILTNQAIGLVLGGGGSRAYAHIGVLMALKESGIPVDMVGGTSMGAVIASQIAMGKSEEEMISLQKMINDKVKPFSEYNLPIISIYGRKRLSAAMQDYYGDIQIEDLWLNAFFVSTNLTQAESVIHRSGSLKKAVTASMSLPGVLPPVVENNELLVDGCVLNNLPGDVMKEINSGKTIVVNVNPKEDLLLEDNFEELPTPMQIIRNRLNPFRKHIKFPSIMKIMMRSNLLHAINQEEDIASRADYYLQPPVEAFSIMDLKSIDQIVELGYEYAQKEIRNWQM